MQKLHPVLLDCRLFAGIKGGELEKMLDCLSARQKSFAKNSFIFSEGDKIEQVGIVLSGTVHIVRDDFWGKRTIVTLIRPGELFGEAFACADVEKLPVSVLAAEDSEILFINTKRIIMTCPAACIYHSNLIKNLTVLLAERSVALIQKLEHITQASTREKLLSYLSEEARLAGKNTFCIPFNREELAGYLSVERSAMSAELSKMRKDGLIVFQKNNFELLKKDS